MVRAMFLNFFTALKDAAVPVTLREYLTLMEAMEHDLAGRRVEDFYYLSRATFVKWPPSLRQTWFSWRP